MKVLHCKGWPLLSAGGYQQHNPHSRQRVLLDGLKRVAGTVEDPRLQSVRPVTVAT